MSERTVIKVGDSVKWRAADGTVLSGKVLLIYDIDRQAAAVLDCKGIAGPCIAMVTDLEPERKPGDTTILSGG